MIPHVKQSLNEKYLRNICSIYVHRNIICCSLAIFYICSQKNFIMVKTHIYCTIESVMVFFFTKSTKILNYSKFRIILHRENKTSKTLPILIFMSIFVFLLAIPDRINSIYLVLCMTYYINFGIN